ncbi:MAG: RNA methyltransferase [Myxococcales bacterium]|nr:RNA methyltransferase [Myxococcales bacterium]MCB9719010.1 RNA methyltransferase [Myxococcales bacterium]
MDLHAAERLVAEHGADRVTDALTPHLSEARRARIEAVVGGRMASVHVAVEAPSDPHNAAAIVRTAEALGALGVHVIAAEGRALHARATTQGCSHWVQTYHHEDLEGFLHRIRGLGLRLHGAAMDGSVPVTRLGVDEPLCLLLGNEQRGLSKAARGACSTLFHVPMVGMSESLNLSVTAAISLFEVLRRKRESGSLGDLDQAGRARLRACYYAVGVDDRLVHALFGSSAVEASP